MTSAPDHLRTDAGGDGFPVTTARPQLSWRPSGAETEVFEIELVVGDREPRTIPVTGLHVAWPTTPLRSGEKVRWRVRPAIPDATWSAWSSFEASLQDEDWRAGWITPVENREARPGHRPAHVLFTNFDVRGPVREARLYSTALGVYTATLNDRRIGTTELAPGSTSYDRTVYAQATDVTDLVATGENRIEIELSDGWYRGQVGAFRIPAQWGETLAFRAELHLHLADETTQIIRTDESWQSRASKIVAADLMEGQRVDFTVPENESSPVLVDRVEAPPISWSPAPPVRVTETRAAVSVTRPRPGVWVLDFGQNASGWVRLTDLGGRGTRTTLDFGEYLGADGDLSTAHLDSERPGKPAKTFVQHDEVVSSGAAGEVFEPRHTVHGFRYARITRPDAPFDPGSAIMQVVNTDLERTGSFTSSNADLNRLHEIADWSFRGNAVDVPTDCPTRERLAWTGDYQVFAPTATRLYDVLGFSRKWLQSVRDDQLDDGCITNFSPDGRRIKHHLDDQFAMMTGSSGWGDAIVAVPWELYLSYGDERVLAENWEAMTRWLSWVEEKAATTRHHARAQAAPEPEAFERYLWDGTFHWGEWTEPQQRDADGKRINPISDNPMVWFLADKGEVGTAYFHRSARTLARIAAVLGKPEEELRYGELADHVLAAWRAAYLRPDGTTVQDTQAAYVRALTFGLIPDELRGAALERLVQLIREAGNHLGTGFLATGDLLPILTDHGRADVAFDLLFQRSEPSWLTMIDRGATTIWEDWHGIDENGAAHASLNHYSKGAVIRFLHTHVLGLRQQAESVGWERIVIAPTPGPDVTWARGHHNGPRGRIDVSWTQDEDAFVLDVTIPPLTTAQILLPDGTTRDAGPGTHRFTALPATASQR